VAAFFAGGAALFAYLTIKSQREQIDEQRRFIAEQSQNLQLERAEFRALAEERHRAQALEVTLTASMARGQDGGVWQAILLNASQEPIRNVTVRFGGDMPAVEIFEVRAVQGEVGAVYDAAVAVIGSQRRFAFKCGQMSAEALPVHPPVAQFTDAAGVSWTLDHYGDLQEADR
jgi:hypothetical protein